jgi:hypothetical protein
MGLTGDATLYERVRAASWTMQAPSGTQFPSSRST